MKSNPDQKQQGDTQNKTNKNKAIKTKKTTIF